MISENKILSIIYIIVSQYEPDKIILFGSYARGDATENSDLDLFIVKNTDKPRYQRGMEIRKLLYGSMIPIDIVVFTPYEIESSKDIKYSFVNEVIKSGKILYEK